MMQPPLRQRIIRSAASRPHKKTPVKLLTSMTACHCSRLSCAGDFAVLGLDEQAVAQDAGIRDAAVEPAEVRDDAIESADDVGLDADVRGEVPARTPSARHASRTAARPRCVEVDQCEVGAARGEALAIAAPPSPGRHL